MENEVKKIIGTVGKLLPMQTKMSPSAAREILQNYSPKPIGTCRANNKVAIDYDLQIIVPCYNVEKYVWQCLDSILKQKTSYRVLVSIVNDGSTDGTADILQQLLWEANAEKMMGGGGHCWVNHAGKQRLIRCTQYSTSGAQGNVHCIFGFG